MRQKRSGAYQIVNEATGKSYVGSSKDVDNRWKQWRYCFKRVARFRSKLYNAARKYGVEHFTFILLEECEPTKETLEALEQHYIDTLKPEYNILQTAYSPLGIKRSDETRIRISASKKGKSTAAKGKPKSEEHKQKLRVPKTEAHKQKLSEANLRPSQAYHS